MKSTLLAASAAAFVLLAPSAHAVAWADIQFAGMDLSVRGTQNTFNYGAVWFGKDLAEGESYSQTFNYSITLHNDGLQFPFGVLRSWAPVCSPFGNFDPDCPPGFSGYEQVQFEFNYDETQYGDPAFQYTLSGWPTTSPISAPAGQTVQVFGSFTITETNVETNPLADFRWGSLSAMEIHAATWVDTAPPSPVPEPAGFALMLAGVTLLRRRLSSSRS